MIRQEQINAILTALMDDNIEFEVISVPPGSTIEAEMAKRGLKPEPEPEPEPTLHQAEWPYGAPKDDPTSEDKRLRALEAVRRHQARILEALDIYKELEKSLSKPKEERTSLDALNEIMLMIQLKSGPV